jgi:hypothetical protein
VDALHDVYAGSDPDRVALLPFAFLVQLILTQKQRLQRLDLPIYSLGQPY